MNNLGLPITRGDLGVANNGASFINGQLFVIDMRVLFICVGNTCRSQMAEGWAKHLGLEAESAGASSYESVVAPKAVAVMAEKGIDISVQYPKSINDVDVDSFNLIYSMGCGVSCPEIPLNDDWELSDPWGDDIAKYRQTRDEIELRVRGLL
ncbi:MAG: arsenate reductase ArsC [Candidatus Thalassarchaeaceae archaeon]|nr:arsenate reductase ArsC [Candidatus Thalassarchaeaceae archaeon]